MDANEVNAAPVTAAGMTARIGELERKAVTRLEALNQAHIGLRDNSEAWHRETESDFEKRQARHQGAADYEERLADELAIDLDRDMKPLHARLHGPVGLGLTASEWDRSGALSALATSRAASAPLAELAADLRGALAAGDKARCAAFLVAAEHRLASAPSPRTPDGALIPWPQEAAALRAAIAETRVELRDRSLDLVRSRFRDLVGASGDLSGRLFRIRAARKPPTTTDGRLKVAWPVREPQAGERIPLGSRR